MVENTLLKIDQVKPFIFQLKLNYNYFKNETDRKYAIYGLFKYCNNYGFKIEKMIGSNQIILTYQYNKDKIITLYDSDNEKELELDKPKTFIVKLESFINQYIMNRDNDQALRAELEATKDKHVPNYDPTYYKFR